MIRKITIITKGFVIIVCYYQLADNLQYLCRTTAVDMGCACSLVSVCVVTGVRFSIEGETFNSSSVVLCGVTDKVFGGVFLFKRIINYCISKIFKLFGTLF